MCTVSMLGDQYKDNFPDRWPQIPMYPSNPIPMPTSIPTPGQATIIVNPSEVTKEEFEALKKEVMELKELLKAAKKYDEATGQKDCQMDDKVAFLKSVADFVGVNLEEVFKK